MGRQAVRRRIGLFAAAVAICAIGLGCGKIARPTPYDPVLMGEPPGPCNPNLASADVGGTDVQGHPVAPAQTGSGGTDRLHGIAPPEVWVRPKPGTYVHVTGIGQTAPSCKPQVGNTKRG